MTRVPLSTRLPPALHQEATMHAAQAGLSLNALVAVALREYLDGRTLPRTRSSVVPSSSAGDVVSPARPAPSSAPRPPSPTTFKAPAGGRNAPCPCGALNAQGYPAKWKHCHGRQAAS